MYQVFSSWIIVLAIFLTHIPYTYADTLPFPDLSYSWYRYQDSIELLKQSDVIGGYPDGTFKPNDPINRAEFLKIVFRARSESMPVAGGDCFSDVIPDAWYAPYVCAAARRSIVDGYPDGTFKPDQDVNIAEAMKILARAYGRDIQDGAGEEWYEPYALSLDRDDVFPRHSYLPWTALTRERAADLIVRLLKFDEERISPRESPGCGKRPEDAATTIQVDGIDRSFLLTIPVRLSPREPTPLVIAFHGRTNSNEQVRSYMKLDRTLTDSIIAYPSALRKDNGTFSWSGPDDPSGWVKDVAFFDAIVEHLADHYCIDMDKIYVVGHSLGAWMANSTACIRSDVIRASATVGGDGISKVCKAPIAAMVIHNPADNLSPFSGAKRIRDERLQSNACTNQSKPSAPQSFNCEIYDQCDGGNPVVFCPHTIDRLNGSYYPHVWPDQTADAIQQFFTGLSD